MMLLNQREEHALQQCNYIPVKFLTASAQNEPTTS